MSVTDPGGTFGSSIPVGHGDGRRRQRDGRVHARGRRPDVQLLQRDLHERLAARWSDAARRRPSAAGSYTVVATFAGSTDYAADAAVAGFQHRPGGSRARRLRRRRHVRRLGLPGHGPSRGSSPGSTTRPAASSRASACAHLLRRDLHERLPALGPHADGRFADRRRAVHRRGQLPRQRRLRRRRGGGRLRRSPQATPTVAVTDAGGTYDLSTFPGTATVAGVVPAVTAPGASLEGVTPVAHLLRRDLHERRAARRRRAARPAPSEAGTYTVLASFPGSADYAAGSAVADFSIAQATPDGERRRRRRDVQRLRLPATATVAGVNGTPGPTLEGTRPRSPTTAGPTPAPRSSPATAPLRSPDARSAPTPSSRRFPGTADYAPATGLANFTIAQATPQVTWNAPASIVYGTPLIGRAARRLLRRRPGDVGVHAGRRRHPAAPAPARRSR